MIESYKVFDPTTGIHTQFDRISLARDELARIKTIEGYSQEVLDMAYIVREIITVFLDAEGRNIGTEAQWVKVE